MNKRFLFGSPISRALPFLGLGLLMTLAFALTALAAPRPAANDPAPLDTQQAEIDLEECPWMDTTLSADQRARLLLDASTLDQKMRWLVEPAANNPSQTQFGSSVYPEQVPCTPVIQYTDSPVAVTSGSPTGVTAFPAQIALAATWNDALSEEKGAAHAYEAFYNHRNVVLGPGLASGRVPYLGRNAEYFGEDPLLGGRIAAAMIRGLEEGNPTIAVEAVIKHYVANEQELDRQDSSSNMDERTLRQIYTLPYEIAIKDGDPGGVMCAFNQVNGVWSCEDPHILQDILKDDWGYPGWVVTDFFGFHNAGPGLANGLDQELVSPRLWGPDALNALLDEGVITEEMIDQAAFRIVRSHIAAGLFDIPLPPTPVEDASTAENQAVAQRIVEEGAVLLKNDGDILPFDGSAGTIAVIGATAAMTETNGVNATTVCTPSRPSGYCDPIAPLDSITERATADGSTVVFDDGSDLASAEAAAASADVAIVFGYYTQGEGEDLPNLSLMPQTNSALVEAVSTGDTNIKISDVDNFSVGSTILIGTDGSQETVMATDVGTAATDTTLGVPASAGDTNIKLPNLGGLVVGDTFTIDTGASQETLTVTDVGTPGGTTVQSATEVGETEIAVGSTAGFAEDDVITIGSGGTLETRTVVDISGFGAPRITVGEPLDNAHDVGAPVAGSGITFTPALAQDHEAGVAVQSAGSGISFTPALTQAYDSGTTVFATHGDDLVNAVAAANDNTIVILQTGGPVLMPWVDDVDGVLEVWYAGEKMGDAITALLWGDVNPSGKLPQSFPVSEDDLPTAGSEAQYPGIVDEEGIRQVDYTEGLEVGYRWYDAQNIDPLFPFGFGLSYTTFDYSDLNVASTPQGIEVSFEVTNSGSVAGAEVPQVYLAFPDGLGEPPKRLVGWERITLEPGESTTVTIQVNSSSSDHPLSYWDMDQDGWVTAPGMYTVHVGSSSRDLPLSDSVNLSWWTFLPMVPSLISAQ